MPRSGRTYQRAVCYHLMNRGINRQVTFEDESDYEAFTDLVRLYKERTGAKVYHWVLMGNHYHMVVEVTHAKLREFIGGIQQKYAWAHHQRHGTSGMFWQGRFKSKPVEIGGYLVRVGRYVERNPVRAGMVVEAWAYRWSSAAHYVKGMEDGLTDQNEYLGPMAEAERAMYKQALLSGADEALMKGKGTTRVIGSPEFSARLTVDGGRHRYRSGRPVRA